MTHKKESFTNSQKLQQNSNIFLISAIANSNLSQNHKSRIKSASLKVSSKHILLSHQQEHCISNAESLTKV